MAAITNGYLTIAVTGVNGHQLARVWYRKYPTNICGIITHRGKQFQVIYCRRLSYYWYRDLLAKAGPRGADGLFQYDGYLADEYPIPAVRPWPEAPPEADVVPIRTHPKYAHRTAYKAPRAMKDVKALWIKMPFALRDKLAKRGVEYSYTDDGRVHLFGDERACYLGRRMLERYGFTRFRVVVSGVAA